MDENKTTLFPIELQVAKDAHEQFEYGDMITFSWIYDAFNMHPPKSGTMEEIKEYHFKFLSAVERFKETLLIDHHKMLVNVRGDGYRVLKPEEQTAYVSAKWRQRIVKECTKSMKQLMHIKTDELTEEMIEENINAQIRISTIGKMASAKKNIGFSFDNRLTDESKKKDE